MVYLNSLHGEMVFDDLAVFKNLDSGLPVDVAREFGIAHRPLLWASYRLDAVWRGLGDTFHFHLTNLLIHLICVSLVFGIVLLLGFESIAAGCGALIFAIHPFFTSAVDYIDARGSLLAAMFVLAATLVALHPRLKRAKWLFVAVLLALGVACKEEALVFIPLAFFYCVIHRHWKAVGGLAALAICGFLAISIVAPYIGTPLNTSVVVPVKALVENGGYPGFTLPQYSRILVNGYVFHTLGNLLLPLHLTIDPPNDASWWKFIVSLLVMAGLVALVLWRRLVIEFRYAAAALLCAPILGCFGILLAEPLFEYRNYILGLGVALVASAIVSVAASPSHAPKVAFGFVAFLLAFGTIQRNEVWRTSIGVWTDALAKAPHKERAVQNLSADLMKVGRRVEAETLLLDDLKVHPEFRGAHLNLAAIYLDMNELDKVTEHARHGLPIAQAYAYLGIADLKRFEPEAALPNLKKAVEMEPLMVLGWMGLHDVYEMQNNKPEAAAMQSMIEKLNRMPVKVAAK